MIVLSLIVGFIIGILSGLLGIGGGTMLIPIFKLGYGLSAIMCTATSLFTVVLTAISGGISHIRNKTCVPMLGLACGLGGILTSPVGVWLATISPEWLIIVVAAAVIIYSAITMLKKAITMGKPDKDSPSKGDPTSNSINKPSPSVEAQSIPHITKRQFGMGILIGLVAGVASGYVGVGGGFIMVPMMIQLIHAPMKLVSGTSLIAVMILAIPGVAYQAYLGHVVWSAGIAVAVGSIPGALIGAKFIPLVPERTLRFLFGIILFVASVLLIANQFGIMG